MFGILLSVTIENTAVPLFLSLARAHSSVLSFTLALFSSLVTALSSFSSRNFHFSIVEYLHHPFFRHSYERVRIIHTHTYTYIRTYIHTFKAHTSLELLISTVLLSISWSWKLPLLKHNTEVVIERLFLLFWQSLHYFERSRLVFFCNYTIRKSLKAYKFHRINHLRGISLRHSTESKNFYTRVFPSFLVFFFLFYPLANNNNNKNSNNNIIIIRDLGLALKSMITMEEFGKRVSLPFGPEEDLTPTHLEFVSS